MLRWLMLVLMVLSLATVAQADYIAQRKAAVELMRSGKAEEALAAFLALGDGEFSDVQKTDALRQAVTLACQLKRFDQAMDLAKRMPLPSHAKAAQMDVLLRQRLFAPLIEQFGKEPIETWPSDVSGPALSHRAQALASLKQGDAAEADFAKALEYTPGTLARGEICVLRGDNAQTNLNDLDKALAAYQQAIELTATTGSWVRYSAVIRAAAVLRQTQRLDEAMQTLNSVDTAKTVATWAGQVLAARAEVWLARGDKAQAIACLKEALALKDAAAYLTGDWQRRLDALQNPAPAP